MAYKNREDEIANRRKWHKARNDMRRAAGHCMKCGGVRDDPNYKNCSQCRRKLVEYDKARDKKKRNEQQNERRSIREERGVCTLCGGVRDSYDYKHCAKCRDKSKEYTRQRHANIQDNECSCCGKPKESEEFKTCKSCREKECERGRKRRLINPRYNAESQKKWGQNNREKVRELDRIWREKNHEKVLGYDHKWKKNNPEKMRVHNQNRRARLKGNGGRLPLSVENILFEQQNGCCYLCGDLLYARFNDLPSVDHVVPISLGGRNDLSNVKLAHLSCNLKKGTKLSVEYMFISSYIDNLKRG